VSRKTLPLITSLLLTAARGAATPIRHTQTVDRLSFQEKALRGHGLIAKIPRARRYRVTRHGQRVMTAAIAVHDDRFADSYNAAT
jgi:hypothetical protein